MSQNSLLPSDRAQALNILEAAQGSPSGIVSRTVVNTPDLRVIAFHFDSGQELTSHTNRRRALVQVLTGECEFLYEGDWHRLSCGTFLHLPPQHPHAVRASFGAFSMVLTLGPDASNEPKALAPL